MQRDERFNSADRIIRIGFWINAVLMIVKLAAGHWGRSEAVFADGLESGCDFVGIFSSMVALRIGRKPLDAQHPYGHGRAENLSALLISLIIFLTGAWILAGATQTILHKDFKTPGAIAVVAALVTIAVKEWLYRFTSRTGAHIESPSLLAVAKDHRKDAITSVATLIGVGGAYLGQGIMDPLAAGLTSFFILYIGYATFRDSAHDLMDGSVHSGLLDEVTLLAENVAGVEHVHEIRARRSGQFTIIDLKLDMDPSMTVKESHDIATHVKKLIFDRFSSVGDVMIHINPHEEEHEDLTRL